MDEQLALVARLKVALGRAGERAAAQEVLRSLQNRNDLYQVRYSKPLIGRISGAAQHISDFATRRMR
jgi:hypothetical protein